MAAHRPIAHRAFAVMLAVLLVGSVVAPIAVTGTVAAQNSGDSIEINEDCGAMAKFAFPRSCHAAEATFGDIDTSQESSAIEVDTHTSAVGVYEGTQQSTSVYQNYLEDTETLASLEARHAIATAYENNKTAIEAQAAGQQAINDYYAHHQIQLAERASADSAELAYLMNVTHQDPDISDEFIHAWTANHDGSTSSESFAFTGNTSTQTMTLVNGSEYQHEQLEIETSWSTSGGSTGGGVYNDSLFDDYHAETDDFNVSAGVDNDWSWPGGIQVMNAPAASLDSATVYDYRLTAKQSHRIEQQAQTVQNNYPSTVAEDLYAEMDAGNLSPNDVRGAEGMVRYMSGNETSGDSLEYGLRSTLDLPQPDDVESTMTVHFDGKTDRQRSVNSSTGAVSYDYTTVNETYTGMLYAGGFPNGSAETGVSYNVSDFEKQPSMVLSTGESDTTEEVVFWEGQFTIQNMTDSNGSTVETMEYSGPSYSTYDASGYIDGLEEASDEREQIVSKTSDEDDGLLGGAGGWLPEDGSGDMWLAAAFLIAIIAIVAAAVTNLAGELGP
ncbi:hypothetical protein [Natrinema longum]|uniref:Envelope protein N-terminal domain-containing protein n=2 Tax=Natrinema longum TaxID=370324 RepID=A0A8A2U8Q6_9EURY|nr:hypothetical protein [Natrinema longum]QSW84328.1 hypothetical protein J0X27_12810 [Natrinema longum]